MWWHGLMLSSWNSKVFGNGLHTRTEKDIASSRLMRKPTESARLHLYTPKL